MVYVPIKLHRSLLYNRGTNVGGTHYKTAIQPVEYIHANDIGFCEGNVIKYVSRWKKKNGLNDLEKAKHYLELLIQLETEGDNNGKS